MTEQFTNITHSLMPIGSFASVADYLAAVPSRSSETLKRDLKQIAASKTRRNPFTKAMREAAQERLAEIC